MIVNRRKQKLGIGLGIVLGLGLLGAFVLALGLFVISYQLWTEQTNAPPPFSWFTDNLPLSSFLFLASGVLLLIGIIVSFFSRRLATATSGLSIALLITILVAPNFTGMGDSYYTLNFIMLLVLLSSGYGIGAGAIFEILAAPKSHFSERRQKYRLQKKYALLKQMQDFEEKIQLLISEDPANLTVKAGEIRRLFKGFSIDQIREEIKKMSQELQKINNEREITEERHSTLKSEEERLKSALQTIQSRLEELREEDPANIQVRIEDLHYKWRNLSELQLEATIAHGEVAQLVKEELVYDFQIITTKRELDAVRENIEALHRSEYAAQLRKMILEKQLLGLNANVKPSEVEAELGKVEKQSNRFE